ncbi:hypothetical protein [Nonomuraea aridisoli]|uniref:Uncharacterized protein n=1 Tax=Nonomuraea aridisoli TaxID=2070368 RepID=A0A2W2G156_9ACTN|nr:hypothetical protein [Nonomuraea aridisoli]PZG20614.1 hypothetical protein C1J01_08925 [Nonomuraea aridisoli]
MISTPPSHWANVQLTYHQIQLRDAEEGGPAPLETQGNGLIVVDDEPDGATILTGIAIGAVDVEVQLTDAPPGLDLDSWEEVVEVSIESTTGSLIVCGLDGDLPDLPNLAHHGSGFYRLRVHARGRDTDPDGSANTPLPFEHYLIISWPAPSAPEQAFKHTDAFGRERRNPKL